MQILPRLIDVFSTKYLFWLATTNNRNHTHLSIRSKSKSNVSMSRASRSLAST
jgi:hypothetical protein